MRSGLLHENHALRIRQSRRVRPECWQKCHFLPCSGASFALQRLVEHPARCRLREEYGAGVRVAVHGRYLIFYTERADTVVIERVLHGARHLDWVQF